MLFPRRNRQLRHRKLRRRPLHLLPGHKLQGPQRSKLSIKVQCFFSSSNVKHSNAPGYRVSSQNPLRIFLKTRCGFPLF